MSTRLRALGVVAATVLLTGGCAAGTHPGAAAVVGKTEISISDVDNTSRAVTTALGQNFNANATLRTLVTNAMAAEVAQQKSITITPAETAQSALQAVGENQEAYAKFQSEADTRDFLNAVGNTQLIALKLAGGGVNDMQNQAKLQQAQMAINEASKGIDITIAPRFGKWTGSDVDNTISGSLSKESKQTAAQREAAENAAKQQQQQGQG
ncbi:hypothetical protein [Kribbella sp. NPDC048928]|uniref:hypothetical protein n=1 Tax=Kribbella sp. NPDC048928 TaxID=3364111 RepID=UPI0037204EE7